MEELSFVVGIFLFISGGINFDFLMFELILLKIEFLLESIEFDLKMYQLDFLKDVENGIIEVCGLIFLYKFFEIFGVLIGKDEIEFGIGR